MDKYVGKRLDGRYEIREIIGVGGMAVVYKAWDNQENRTVAIKILKEEFTSNEEFVRRFKNESKAIAMLSHPNIVNVYDVSFGDLIQYIVMEYIEGITLKEFIEREGSLRWKDTVHFTLQILKGLQHAHDKGIVHRDVKPQNIMVLADGTIKVTDFGIARFARSDQRTITDKAIGSVHYISPEQARGEKTDEKADIYSVGVMMYEMLTGKLPFDAESAVSVAIMQLQRDPQLPTEINGSIPRGLEQITMHAMQKTPERRYQSAAEMLFDLSQFRKDPSLTFDYSYFVDNSPTKYVGKITEDNDKDMYYDDESKEKNNIIPILAGIAVTLLVALGVLAAIFLPKLFSGTGAEIECPDFVGKKYEDIVKNKEYTDNFDFNDEWDHNAEYEYGYVYEQSETEGKKLKKDAKITLYVSMGTSTKRVPDVYGKTESAAVSELKSNKFKTVISEEPSEDVEAGLVIRTEPQRTQVVNEGETITIFVSSGKPTKNVKIPDVVGLTKEAAEEALKDEGLVAEFEDTHITTEDKYYPTGYVVKQDPETSSTKVPEGTKVKVYVCAGYKFDVVVDELPIDFESESYYLSLWENGKLFKMGDKVDSSELMTYTFKDLTTTETSLNLVIKISSGTDTKEHEFRSIKVDNKTGRITTVKEYSNYPKADSSDDSQNNDNDSENNTNGEN
ncbi:MAG: Stk1 family PASTA domain-containing Ser/Thr kinase [Ruminococcaceae bacterium]|nr:Stk1 family PASTA domain-containing Ser/Thr kinase [Oscillospiraceae bacterium]